MQNFDKIKKIQENLQIIWKLEIHKKNTIPHKLYTFTKKIASRKSNFIFMRV